MTNTLFGYRPLVAGSRILNRWEVPGADTELILRRGAPGFLLIHFATRFDRRVEKLKEPILDDWGHAFRPIRGYSQLSRHAYGLAEDLNATDHPLGQEDTFSEEDEIRIQKMLKKYDGCLRWGGNYHGRKDEMHVEIDRPRAEVEVVARRLAQTERGRLILKANPGQKRLILGGR